MPQKEPTEIGLLTEISRKLDLLVALTATQGKDRDDKIKILTGLGFTNVQISELVGIPKGTVDTVRARKGGRK